MIVEASGSNFEKRVDVPKTPESPESRKEEEFTPEHAEQEIGKDVKQLDLEVSREAESIINESPTDNEKSTLHNVLEALRSKAGAAVFRAQYKLSGGISNEVLRNHLYRAKTGQGFTREEHFSSERYGPEIYQEMKKNREEVMEIADNIIDPKTGKLLRVPDEELKKVILGKAKASREWWEKQERKSREADLKITEGRIVDIRSEYMHRAREEIDRGQDLKLARTGSTIITIEKELKKIRKKRKKIRKKVGS